MPADKTVDFVVMFVVFGMLAAGLGSMALGWIVNHFPALMSRSPAPAPQTAQTARQTDYVSEADLWLDRLEVDRTKTALIELLVYSGWEVGQIRGVLKGDNGTIGAEIQAAKIRLGMVDEPRHLRVKDDHGERLIPMDA
jgi:hypothetical protein